MIHQPFFAEHKGEQERRRPAYFPYTPLRTK